MEADTPQGEKAQTVGDLMGSQDPPAHFELGIELQRGINLKVRAVRPDFRKFSTTRKNFMKKLIL